MIYSPESIHRMVHQAVDQAVHSEQRSHARSQRALARAARVLGPSAAFDANEDASAEQRIVKLLRDRGQIERDETPADPWAVLETYLNGLEDGRSEGIDRYGDTAFRAVEQAHRTNREIARAHDSREQSFVDRYLSGDAA